MSRHDQFIPHLVVSDGMAALKFYQEVFGAKTGDVMMEPQGTRLMHGEIILDGHMLFVSDEFLEKQDVTTRTPRTLGGTTARITLQTDDPDAVVERACARRERVDADAEHVLGCALRKDRRPVRTRVGYQPAVGRANTGSDQRRSRGILRQAAALAGIRFRTA